MLTQGQINALLEQSQFEQSSLKTSQIQSRLQQNRTKQLKESNISNSYGNQEFDQYQQSKRTQGLKNNLYQKSQYNQSYANDQFQSYQQSKMTKQFQKSYQNINKNNKKVQNQLKPIQQIPKPNKKTTFNKNIGYESTSMKKIKNQITDIQGIDQVYKAKQKQKPQQIQTKQNNHTPFNYTRLQQRQKQLLFTTITQQNKRLKQQLSQKDKQLISVKTKYNILLQQKAQHLNSAKQAILNKKLTQLQQKYNLLVKQKAKQRAFQKTISNDIMTRTMKNNYVAEEEVKEREDELMAIIEKLKERLISTDKQLKTLQAKMNQGLDYQEQLQRKLKRVEQLDFRIQKMQNQAQQDRLFIQTLKEKTQQQKNKIQQLQEQKNLLQISLKRTQMTQITQSDILQQLQQTRKQKQLLQKSLRQMTKQFAKAPPKRPNMKQFVDIQDSNQLLNFK